MAKVQFTDGKNANIKFDEKKRKTVIQKERKKRNPPWTRDEIILALNFYKKYFPNIPDKLSEEMRSLSELLRNLKIQMGEPIDDSFRNPNGVYMKLMNFHSLNDEYTGKGLVSASVLDKEIFDNFFKNEKELEKLSGVISDLINSNEPSLKYDSDDDAHYEIQEGKLLMRVHRFRERDRKIINLKKEKVFKNTGSLKCEGCDFDFEKKYGKHGSGFIECHHTLPVSQIKVGQKTKLEDLSLLCSNCHRMIHRRVPWLKIEELKSIIA